MQQNGRDTVCNVNKSSRIRWKGGKSPGGPGVKRSIVRKMEEIKVEKIYHQLLRNIA